MVSSLALAKSLTIFIYLYITEKEIIKLSFLALPIEVKLKLQEMLGIIWKLLQPKCFGELVGETWRGYQSPMLENLWLYVIDMQGNIVRCVINFTV